jgi:co-chaperonin GroES (HSP10)
MKRKIMLNIIPLKNKVYVAQHKPEVTTGSGIILTSTRGGDTIPADVIAVGPDVTEVKPGDMVYLNWGKCTPVKVADNVERAVISVDEIIAVVEK